MIVEELMEAVRSDRFQRFLEALRAMGEVEREAMLDVVLTGPPADRVDLCLPPGVECTRRRFVEGPTADFAITKTAPTGALITIFVTLSPPDRQGMTFERVLPWNPCNN